MYTLAGRLLEHEFKKADWDKDGKISLQDFTCYYEKVAKLQIQMAREGRIKSASHGTQIPVGGCMRVCVFEHGTQIPVGVCVCVLVCV